MRHYNRGDEVTFTITAKVLATNDYEDMDKGYVLFDAQEQVFILPADVIDHSYISNQQMLAQKAEGQ